MNSIVKKIHADLYCGLSFFSRLPVQWLYRSNFPFSFGRAIWTWPGVSLILGLLISIFFYSACHIFHSAWIIAFLTLGFQLLLTGGLHEDGLADMADGFGGGKDKENKLTIMRDSRLGSYGVLTLFVILGLQASCLSFFAQYSSKAVPILIITAVLSRMSMLFPIYFSKPARSNGLASHIAENIPRSSTFTAIALSILISFILIPWNSAIKFIAISILISVGVTLFSQKHIQGYTGDILGATQVLVTTGILIFSTIEIP